MIASKRVWDTESIHSARQLHKATADGSQWDTHQRHRAAKRLWTLVSEVTIVLLLIELEKGAGRVRKNKMAAKQ